VPDHNGFQSDITVCIAAARTLWRRKLQQPILERIDIKLMITTFGWQKAVELEDAAVLESPQYAD
jgi:hypothetical protein